MTSAFQWPRHMLLFSCLDFSRYDPAVKLHWEKRNPGGSPCPCLSQVQAERTVYHLTEISSFAPAVLVHFWRVSSWPSGVSASLVLDIGWNHFSHCIVLNGISIFLPFLASPQVWSVSGNSPHRLNKKLWKHFYNNLENYELKLW